MQHNKQDYWEVLLRTLIFQVIIIIIIIIIIDSYYDRDSKDLHARICMNPPKGAQCMNTMIDLSD